MGSEIAEARQGRNTRETSDKKKKQQDAETRYAGVIWKRSNRCEESPEDTRIVKKAKTCFDRRDESCCSGDHEAQDPGCLTRRYETPTPETSDSDRQNKTPTPEPLYETSDSDEPGRLNCSNRWYETSDSERQNDTHAPGRLARRYETPTPETSDSDRQNETRAPGRLARRYETPTPVTLHETSDSDEPGRLNCSNRWYETPPPKTTWDKTPESERDSASSGGLGLSDWRYYPTPDWRDETPTTEDGAIFDLDELNIPAILPFLKAVGQSKDSWQARHKGIGFVQQIAILMGQAVLPHLPSIVQIIEPGLSDKYEMVRTSTALSLAALAKASAPHGNISFEPVLKPLLKGIRTHHAYDLDAFMKAIGCIIPLMDAVNASYYTKKVMVLLKRDFNQSCNEARRKILLKVVKRCVSTEGVEADYIQRHIVPELFRCFWNGEAAYVHSKQLVETTFEIAKKVGVADVVGRIAEDLKNESEPYRMVVMEAIEKIIANLGVTDIDAHLEELLIDGILYAFEEQDRYDSKNVVLNGFGTVVNLLGWRMKPYLPQVCDTITRCLQKDSADVRQNAADLISQIAVVLKHCEAQEFMGDLGVVLYENLAEGCPEVLGSILGALKAIVNVSDATNLQPTIKNLLRRLALILKNRHEKEVLENCVELVYLVADML
ncbi:hypothetical protein ACET3Z_028654 [Daucus carota]